MCVPVEHESLSANAEASKGDIRCLFLVTLVAYAFESGSSTELGTRLEARGQMLRDPLVSASP